MKSKEDGIHPHWGRSALEYILLTSYYCRSCSTFLQIKIFGYYWVSSHRPPPFPLSSLAKVVNFHSMFHLLLSISKPTKASRALGSKSRGKGKKLLIHHDDLIAHHPLPLLLIVGY